jgi:hypothetical protein
MEWSGEIIRAINEATVLVLIYSRNANSSKQVHREIERAVAKGIAIVPFRIENVPASETLEYFISTPHWLDALTPPLEQHLEYLADTVALLKSRLGGQPAPESRPRPTPIAPAPTARRWNSRLTMGAGGAVVLVVALLGWLLLGGGGGEADFWHGAWATDNRVQGLPAHFTLNVDDDNRYTGSVETRDAGTIRFSGNAYRMVSENGPVAQGSINLLSPTTAQISGPLGTATWQRELSSATSGTGSAVGVWMMSATIQQVPWAIQLAIMPNGRFELRSRSEDSGTFSVKDGTWFMNSARGFPQNGTYTRVDDRTVRMTGPLGTATWTRQR